MEVLDFIFNRATEKFVQDTEGDLYRYRDTLKEQIESGDDKDRAREVLAEVNKKLGIEEQEEEDGASPVASDERSREWAKKQERRRKVFEAEVKKSLRKHFG